MDKVMPTIQMPTPEPEPEPQVDTSNIIPETDERDIIDDIMNDIETDLPDEDIIKITEREIPEEDEVFTEPPVTEPVVNTEFIDPEEKKGKRKYTRKQPMSQKQKDHLAKIRKIAQEKRKVEKERKAAEKEEAQLKKVEERLLKKKQKEEVAATPRPPPAQPKAEPQQEYFTKEDLDRAMLGAITQYDTYRKQQKKEKKEKQIADLKEKQMRETIQRAITPQQINNDPWRGLFT